MKSIKKIGKMALIKLFSSGRYRGGIIRFPEEEFDLSQVYDDLYFNQHYGEIQSRGGINHYVWGIELGLRRLSLTKGKTIEDGLLQFFIEVQYARPSHIIVSNWFSSDLTDDETTYTVYRLSERQEQALEVAWQQRHMSTSLPAVVTAA